VLVWSVRRPDTLDRSTGIGRDPARYPSLAFSRDGRRLAYFTEGFTALQVHATDRPQSPPLLLRVPDRGGKSEPPGQLPVLEFLTLELSDDGTKIATGDRGGAHVWDTSMGKLLASLPTRTSTLALALDHDASRLFTRGSQSEVDAWETDRGARIATFGRYPPMDGPMALARNGRRLAIGAGDNLVLVFDPEQPEAPPITLKGHSGPVTCLALSADGTWLVSGSVDGTARLWDLERGSALRTLTSHKRGVQALWLSDDARQLLTGGSDGMVVNWDLTSGGLIAGYPGTSEVFSLSTFPAGVNPRLLAISTNRGCDVWDLEVGQTLIHLGTDRPTIAAFDPAAAQPTLAWGVTGQRVYLRDFGADALKRGARRVANRDLSAEEFERYTRDEVPPGPAPPRTTPKPEEGPHPTPKRDADLTKP
ncbi:MAG: hypothetical protein LC745_01580, partial [Planctomycetia bacterium]|nr:hypothetical protein [Planctomycetia bacterium]